jgi:autophagy-related protein 9
MAYRYANTYLAQFPKDKTEQISSFVSLVTGAFLSVLIAFTLLDSELFLNFEITPGRNALLYITILGAIYRAARGSSPQQDQVADPTFFLSHVIFHTRYEPGSWKDRLHTDEVRGEFAQLYQPKVLIFAEEILSMVITPFLLIFRLPNSSDRIVDFFREFSIVVDGLGVVCSYSMFPFKKGENNVPANRTGGPREDAELREEYFMAKDNKMLASYYGFLETYTSQPQGGYNGRLQGRGGSFHPPPQFPNNFGQGSQVAQSTGMEATVRGTSRGPAGRQASTRRTPKPGLFGPSESINSTLLDPHHHPQVSALRGSPRQGPQGRFRTSLQSVPDQSNRIEEESTLGDSWRTSRLAQNDDEDEEEAQGNNQGGVLQLLRQFSKAQAEGRGAGVGV